jgi:hypothetical protein
MSKFPALISVGLAAALGASVFAAPILFELSPAQAKTHTAKGHAGKAHARSDDKSEARDKEEARGKKEAHRASRRRRVSCAIATWLPLWLPAWLSP